MTDNVAEQVATHYAPSDLRSRVSSVLEAAGKDGTNTGVLDLASLDQSHVMGTLATRRLAERAGVRDSYDVIDVGAGMGGPARFLAATYGCHVTGVDITPPYLETAEYLTELTNLSHLVSFRQAEATSLPFVDETFDLGWTQHAVQNVDDKERFFGELRRVLRPGAKAVVHDLYRGRSGDVHFPAMWARDESASFLISDADMRAVIEASGFQIVDWIDGTQEAWDSNAKRAAGDVNAREGQIAVPGLDISLLHGQNWMEMAGNSVKDFEVGSVGIFEAILSRT
ncbi:MAG TPA: methyltransferase domain-containing protein [Solirubrobacteraceae bacterium]|nr:methyltransferase domain-containing protein [Solirubrobacteraceae bacterium]